MNKSVNGSPPLSGAPEGCPRGGATELGSLAETRVGRPWGEDTGVQGMWTWGSSGEEGPAVQLCQNPVSESIYKDAC